MVKYSIVEIITIWYTYAILIKDLTTMNDIIKQIEQADEVQLNEIINVVNRRYSALHSDRVGGFLSLATDSRQCEKELENIIQFVRKCYNCGDG